MSNTNQPPSDKATVPISLITSLLLNDRKLYFLPEDADHLHKSKIYTFKELALLLKYYDPEEKLVHIEAPESQWNTSKDYCVWNISDWKSGEEARQRKQAIQKKAREANIKRDECLFNLYKAMHEQLGLPDDERGRKQAFALAHRFVYNKDVDVAKMYGVDISFLPDEIKTITILGDPLEHFEYIWNRKESK